MENTNSNGIRKEYNFGQLVVSRVYDSQYQKKGTSTAELKQEVEVITYYPSVQVNDGLSDNLFGTEDFNIPAKDYKNTEMRVTWVNVPKGTTPEQVKEKLTKEAKIKKMVSNHPILSDSQRRAIEAGLTTKDEIANSQVVRYPSGSENEGDIVLQNGKPFYMRRTLSLNGDIDTDERTSEPNDFYASSEILAELEDVTEDIQSL